MKLAMIYSVCQVRNDQREILEKMSLFAGVAAEKVPSFDFVCLMSIVQREILGRKSLIVVVVVVVVVEKLCFEYLTKVDQKEVLERRNLTVVVVVAVVVAKMCFVYLMKIDRMGILRRKNLIVLVVGVANLYSVYLVRIDRRGAMQTMSRIVQVVVDLAVDYSILDLQKGLAVDAVRTRLVDVMRITIVFGI